MRTNRRVFVVGGLAAIAGGAGAAGVDGAETGNADTAPPDAPLCLDYGLSFICNTARFNAVRFWVESRTIVIDDRTGASTEFYQCGSCKSENTFAEKGLLKEDNYDFLPILGDGQWLIFRRRAGVRGTYREVRKTEELWGKPVLKLHMAQRATPLASWEEIRDATAAGLPIVSRTEINSDATGLRAVIECPVKTMNISLEKRLYQVDTGPIAFPDLTKPYENLIECLSLAFVAFNASCFADFVVEQPTPVIEEGREVCKVYHYSRPFSLPAANTLYAIALPT
ncbi:MAG TPA: hypothetical protein EYP56_21610 [Planctomycetaceae bacterium]|nr:hypothetical protein [Planctomycetaceae bacterium]